MYSFIACLPVLADVKEALSEKRIVSFVHHISSACLHIGQYSVHALIGDRKEGAVEEFGENEMKVGWGQERGRGASRWFLQLSR